MKFLLATTLLLAGSSTAAPLRKRGGDTSAAQIILQIAPGSASCTDTKECRTAEQAAPFLIDAMVKYGVTTPSEIAAVLALMAFESVDLKYKRNVSPGRPGQGTANMQMWNFNLEYAKSIPELQSKVAALGTVTEGDTDKLNQLLDLVIDDQYNFGSAPWFLTTKCSSDVRTKLQSSAYDAGYAAYMACVGVQVDESRTAYWTRAKQAFGLA